MRELPQNDGKKLDCLSVHEDRWQMCFTCPLKVPKREIFDRSDFPDFYTIKSLCVGDFGVKIKKMLNNN
jgi:hypothetical protein